MKALYLIGGTMGVGKTTTGQLLKRRLDNAVYLDGDWCWDADPFHVTAETRAMVLANIGTLLNSFLHCSAYENIIFCWVMHEQAIRDAILSALDTHDCRVINLSLVCTPEALAQRLQPDILAGRRAADILRRSTDRLPLYDALDTIRLDVSHISAEEAARQIMLL